MTYEDKIIKANNEQMELGYEAIHTFYDEASGIAIHDPYYEASGRFKVNPLEEYGQAYTAWQNELVEFEKTCNVFVLDNDMTIVVFKYGKNDYSYAYDNSSCRGTRKEITNEMIEFKIATQDMINEITI